MGTVNVGLYYQCFKGSREYWLTFILIIEIGQIKYDIWNKATLEES